MSDPETYIDFRDDYSVERLWFERGVLGVLPLGGAALALAETTVDNSIPHVIILATGWMGILSGVGISGLSMFAAWLHGRAKDAEIND